MKDTKALRTGHLLHTKAQENKGRTKLMQTTENITWNLRLARPTAENFQMGLLPVGSLKARSGKRRITIMLNILKVRGRRILLILQVIGITMEANGSRGPQSLPPVSTQLGPLPTHRTAPCSLWICLCLFLQGPHTVRLCIWVSIYFV